MSSGSNKDVMLNRIMINTKFIPVLRLRCQLLLFLPFVPQLAPFYRFYLCKNHKNRIDEGLDQYISPVLTRSNIPYQKDFLQLIRKI